MHQKHNPAVHRTLRDKAVQRPLGIHSRSHLIDNTTKAILTVIAVALCAIAFRLYFPVGSLGSGPAYGDFIALRDIKDPEQRKEAHLRLIKSLPLVRVHGGQIDADVSGSVSLDN